jgi:hypothetical protein
MNRLIIVTCLFISACATATKITLPNGDSGYDISCAGTGVSVSECFRKAGEVCPSGYDVIASHNQGGNIYWQGQYITTSDKGMLITCK